MVVAQRSSWTERVTPTPIANGPGIGPFVVLLGLVVLPFGLATSTDSSTYDVWGVFVWAPVLLVLAFPLCRWVARRTREPDIMGFLFAAAFLKIVVGAVARHHVVFNYYEGVADSRRYDNAAATLVEPIRRFDFTSFGEMTGTRFIEVLTGFVQAIIGETMLGSFLVFSMMGFIGLCCFYVAFCEALPMGDRLLYRRLLFLTPSMWFWPSSVGKESFLLMCMGAATLGLARLFNGHFSGLIVGGLGLWGTIVVRPHMAIVLFAGAGAALLPGRLRVVVAGRRRRPMLALVLPLFALAALPFLGDAVERFFGIEEISFESAQEVRDDVERNSSQGGSEFEAPDTSTPQGMGLAIVTMFARPFPWEVTGTTSALAAAEAAGLAIVLTVAAVRRGTRLIGALVERWPRLALVYVLMFSWAFSVVMNFGILARQRSLMLPFLFVLVSSVTRPGMAPPTVEPASSPDGRRVRPSSPLLPAS